MAAPIERIEHLQGHVFYRIWSEYASDSIAFEPGELMVLLSFLQENEDEITQDTLSNRVNDEMKGGEHMTTVQEQAIEWIHQALKFDTAVTDEIVATVPSIPLSMAGLPYCSACESVLCGACGHCHMLDIVDFSMPDCPLDNDDMGHECMVWFQAFNAIHTVQYMNEEE